MIDMPDDRRIDARNGGYYLAGTGISLESIACALNRNEPAEEIFADFPALESRQKLEGAIAFIKAHSREVEAYLTEGTRAWEEARKLNPPDLVEKARGIRARRNPKSA